MTKQTNNAINNMAKTLGGSSLTNNEISNLAKDAGIAKREGIISEGKYQDKALALHNGGVKLLKLSTAEGKKDAITNLVRDSFFAGMAGIKQESIKNAYMTFMDTVNTGKVHTDTNKSRSNSKAQGGKKGKTNPVAIDALLAKVFNHADFATLNEELQHDIREYLESEGYEIEA